jgi:hypothetical protein
MDTTPAFHPTSDGLTKTLAEGAVLLLRRGVVSLTVRPSRSAGGLADFPDAVGASPRRPGWCSSKKTSPTLRATKRPSGPQGVVLRIGLSPKGLPASAGRA